MNKDNSDERVKKGNNVERKQTERTKGLNKNKKMKVFCLFFLCFEVKREKDLNSFKNNGKYNGFFRVHIVFSKKKREQKHNSKDSFSIISIKKQLFCSWIHHKKRTANKEKQT